jgi:hypothetical protein
MTMIARISTRLACSERYLWQKIIEPTLKLYFLKVIPLGRHTIQLVRIDKETNTIVSQESGRLARTWNHTISFREVAQNVVSYTDEIEIQAGWLTPAIWLFAQLFYRHRQRRWKVLLRNDTNE